MNDKEALETLVLGYDGLALCDRERVGQLITGERRFAGSDQCARGNAIKT